MGLWVSCWNIVFNCLSTPSVARASLSNIVLLKVDFVQLQRSLRSKRIFTTSSIANRSSLRGCNSYIFFFSSSWFSAVFFDELSNQLTGDELYAAQDGRVTYSLPQPSKFIGIRSTWRSDRMRVGGNERTKQATKNPTPKTTNVVAADWRAKPATKPRAYSSSGYQSSDLEGRGCECGEAYCWDQKY